MSKRNWAGWIFVTLCCCWLAGCGADRADKVRAMNATNSKRLSNLYAAFQQSNNTFKGPKDEAEFREYIGKLPEAGLDLYGIKPGSVDGIFVSERDDQPFRIKYGVRGSQYSNDAVIFEETGLDGVRIVGFTGATEKEVSSDQEYDQLWSSKAATKRPRRNAGPRFDATVEAEFDSD